MEIIGDRKFLEPPGDRLHELPPLMIHRFVDVGRLDKVVGMAERIVESEDMIPPSALDAEFLTGQQRKLDLAIQMVEQ